MPGKSRLQFFYDTVAELKKVVWPPRSEATYLTTMVIGATVAVAIILGLTDYAFSELMKFLLLK